MRRRHLTDDRLIDMCFNLPPHDGDRQHVAHCPACSERRTQLARLLADVTEVAAAEADVVFDAERLARQRARVLQRIDQEGRPGRLITFPASAARVAAFRVRPGMRWIAGAAAAGLVIGVLAGHLVHDLPGRSARPPGQSAVPPGPTLQAVSMTQSDEEFLGRMELAIEGTAGSALQPLDDLTPLVWEVAAQ